MKEIRANYDETWKEVIGDYFELFLIFFYPEIYQQINWQIKPISLDQELEQITASAETEKRYADKLYKVWLLNGQEVWILIHIEVQSQYDQDFPMRMFIYNYRAFDLYHKPVISLAILGDESKKWRPTSYQYGFGKSQVKIDFHIVKLLDYQWEDLEKSNNVFAVVVMAHLKTKATTSNLSERQQWKWQLTRLLYERGYNRKEIADLYKVIDLMMALSEELQLSFEEKLTKYQEEIKMPLLTNIEQRALARGQQIGQEIGQQIGQQIGAKETRQQYIIKILENKFNKIPKTLIESIKQIDNMAILDEIFISSVNVNSLEELEQLINGS